MSKDDGGPAFPFYSGNPGMSLRDWFAGMALRHTMQQYSQWVKETHANRPPEHHTKNMAQLAYMVADAMLAERNERDES